MATILVVDDDEPILKLMQDILEPEGHSVLTAPNGRDALSVVKHDRPDLIISDIMMPLLSGPDMCLWIKLDPNYSSIPVVLMSAVSNKPDPDSCDYNAFLAKPFELHELLSVVDQMLPRSFGSR